MGFFSGLAGGFGGVLGFLDSKKQFKKGTQGLAEIDDFFLNRLLPSLTGTFDETLLNAQRGAGEVRRGGDLQVQRLEESRKLASDIGTASRTRARQAFDEGLGLATTGAIGRGLGGTALEREGRLGSARRYVDTLRDIDESVLPIQTGLLAQQGAAENRRGLQNAQAFGNISQSMLGRYSALRDLYGYLGDVRVQRFQSTPPPDYAALGKGVGSLFGSLGL